jgi:WD40 repeat protein
MSFAFKKFSFFQQIELQSHSFPVNSTACAYSTQYIFVGCDDGTIHILNDRFETLASVTGFGHRVLHLAWAEVRFFATCCLLSCPSFLQISGS